MQPYLFVPAVTLSLGDEWTRLGVEAHTAGKPADAERHFRTALSKDPASGSATINLAIVFASIGQTTEALLTADRADFFAPDDPLVQSNRSLVLFEAERVGEALEAALGAVALTPDPPPPNDPIKSAGYLHSRFAAAIVSASAGRPGDAYECYRQMLAVEPKNIAAGQNSCFMQTLMAVGPAELLAQRKEWYEAHRARNADGSNFRVWPHGNSKEPDRPLKVGYVSGDFKSHSAAMIFSNVLLNHSPAVLPYFYSTLPTNPESDNLTAKFREAAGDRWRECLTASDEDLDNQIRNDQIDILVDLSGHTGGMRLGLFTRKPAPIQVTAWGFAHGCGLPEIDYFLGDPVAVPEAERPHFAERIWDLPCIVTYRPPVEYGLSGVSPLPFRRNGYITFGSFSRFEKMSESYLECVRRILEAVPTSRMLFKDHACRRPFTIERIRAALPGVDPSRLLFAITTPHPDHQQAYQTVDLYLDTWPHGAGLVALECLYAGVPIITRYGTQPAGRTAASVLTAMGRPEWIAGTADDFVDLAVSLAMPSQGGLEAARRTLREELVSSPVVAGYAAAVENSYKAMWREWCQKGQ